MTKGFILSSFTDLGVSREIAEALAAKDITEAFPIQDMAIPLALTGTDLIGQARTGTGKTLAFGAPLLQRILTREDRGYEDLDAPGKPQALVVAPTRELAGQVADDLSMAGRNRHARVLTVYGGTAYEPQLEALSGGVDVVVGTPGRLLDLLDRGALVLAHVKILVLDEADRMLDLGFLDDVERLIAATHELRQTMLFSATMPGDIVSLARRHMRHPVNIRAESSSESATVPATAQFVYQAHDLDKPEVIARILQADERGRVIIFCQTKRTCQRVTDDLRDRGFEAAAINGDLSQALRERNLERFRAGKIDVLVATDVAARGIDVEAVTHVINYTCPDDDSTYLHRIGRTGRAGHTGIAITFVDWADVPRWRSINATLGLPFPEPQETYSTSEHLYHDLGIPAGVTGRLKSADAAGDGGGRSGGQRPAGSRNGARTRRGQDRSRAGRRAETASARDDGDSTTTRTRSASTRRRVRRRRRHGEETTG